MCLSVALARVAFTLYLRERAARNQFYERTARSIKGWVAGIATDSEDTLRFSQTAGVHPMIETYPLAEAPRAYERMLSGKARFRVVLTM